MSKNRSKNASSDSAYALVYSTDPTPEKRCSGCSRVLSECVCVKKALVTNFKPAIRIERKGRAGKTVTIVHKLPAHETFLKELCAYIKRSLGTGGTYSISSGEGIVEIQGERKDEVLELVFQYQTKMQSRINPASFIFDKK